MRQFIKENATEIASIALAGLLGLFLLLFPETTASIAFFVAGGALILMGIIRVIQYFRNDAHRSVGSWGLAMGVLLALAGIAVFVLADALIAFLPFVFGCVMLVGGVFKLQGAIDMWRMKMDRWQVNLIGVAASVVLGIVIILNPFSTAVVLMRVIGASLLFEAVQDCVCAGYYHKAKKRF